MDFFRDLWGTDEMEFEEITIVGDRAAFWKGEAAVWKNTAIGLAVIAGLLLVMKGK